MKPRFTGAAAAAKLQQRAATSMPPKTQVSQKPTPKQLPVSHPKFFNEADEILYHLREKVSKALMHHTACQTISLSLKEIHNIDIWEVMKQCNVLTPMDLFKLMGFHFDENHCFKSITPVTELNTLKS